MSMEELQDCVMEWALPVTVTRYYPNARSKGRSDVPISKQFEIMLAVQPMNRSERQLTEGDRNEGRVKAYGIDKLQTVDTGEARIADEFEYQGASYEVARIDDWMLIGGYYRYEAVRKTR